MDRYESLAKTCTVVPVDELRYGDVLAQVTGNEPWIGCPTVRSVRAGFTDEWIIRAQHGQGEYTLRAIIPGTAPNVWVSKPRPTMPRIRPADLAAGNPGGRIRPAIRPIKATAKPADSVTESPREDHHGIALP